MEKIHINDNMKGPSLLKSSGALEIIFAGVGAARAKSHFQTNFLIVKGDHHVMVDLGMTAPTALDQLGIDLCDLEVVLPTHGHADHVGGMESLAIDCRYVCKKKPALVVNPEWERVLWENSLRGGLEYNEQNPEGNRLTLRDYFDIIQPVWKTNSPREIWTCSIGDIDLEIFRTKHTPDSAEGWQDSFLSFGVMIDNRVFVSCDTRFDPDLITLYRHAEYMFHDVQFFPGAVHAPLADLHTLDDEVKSKMELIHIADNWSDQDITGFAGFAQQKTIYRFG